MLPTIEIATLTAITGGAEQSQSFAGQAWQGVKDATGGFTSGLLGFRRDEQLWGDSSSRVSKEAGGFGEFAGTMTRLGRIRGRR